MNRPTLFLALLACMSPCLAQSRQANVAREISFATLKLPLQSELVLLSPEGKRIILSDSGEGARLKGMGLYDFTGERFQRQKSVGTPIAWSPDGRVCAIRSESGWNLLWPDSGRVHSLSRQMKENTGVAAWSPLTRRLAIVAGGGNNKLWIWNGNRVSKGVDWGRVLKFPSWYEGEVSPTGLEWSPDERAVVLRFYGRAERMPDSAEHTIVFDVNRGRLKDIWGGETGTPHWLDGKRLMFKGDDGGLGGAVDLVVAEPYRKRQRVWKSNVVAWALSRRRDFVCALLENGDLVRSSTRQPNWQVIQRRALPARMRAEVTPQLALSPHGDMVAVSNPFGGAGFWLFSTQPKHRWTIYWKAPTGGASLVGWAVGRSLPLVRMWRSGAENAPVTLAQLQKK